MYKNILIIVLCLACVALFAESKQLFTGKEDHNISRGEAANYVRNFQQKNSEEVAAFYFGKEAIETIIAQEGMVGLRIYNGMAEDGKANRVLVGVDANGNDFVDGAIMERGVPDPPVRNPFEMITVK